MNELLTKEQIVQAEKYCTSEQTDHEVDPRVEVLVNELIGRVADKWTLLVIEALVEGGEMRFTRIAEAVGGISQKILTQTLRQMERDGLVVRTLAAFSSIRKFAHKITHGVAIRACWPKCLSE
jgi:DNA-binding HxlR family transcriptional regulator